jgi:Ca2+-binding EF-hand superfamily protein
MEDRDPAVGSYLNPEEEERARLREDFDYNDANHDGRITLDEFIALMRGLDEDFTADECRIGFEEIDTDRSGTIGFAEFAAWWRER